MSAGQSAVIVFPDERERFQGCFPVRTSARDSLIALGLFVFSCLYLRLFYDYSVLNVDEGILLQGAQRILQGQVLYRDFFAFYTPGSYYWMALLFKVFGSSILVARAVLVIYGGIFSAFTYWIARRVSALWASLLASFTVTLTCLPTRFFVLHNWDSTLLACVTLYCAVLLLERRHWAWAFATGSFAALTFLFEHSKGAGILLGLIVGLGVIAWHRRPKYPFDKREIGGLAAGVLWPLVLTFVYFAIKHSIATLVSDWMWPLFHYSVANRLPYGFVELANPNGPELWNGPWLVRIAVLIAMGLFLLLPLLPIAALAVLIWFVIKGPQNSYADGRWDYYVLVSALMSGLLAGTLLTNRADFIHLNYMGPIYYIVLAWLVSGLPLPTGWRFVMRVLALCALLSSLLFGGGVLLRSISARQKLETARGRLRTAGAESMIGYIRSHVQPGERMLVYPYGPIFYYLTGTFSPTHFDFLQPGMHTVDQFQETINDLSNDQTRVVLLQISFSEAYPLVWPNTPIKVIAAKDPVQDYLFTNYRPCAVLTSNGFWHFAFMVRKNGASSLSTGGAPCEPVR